MTADCGGCSGGREASLSGGILMGGTSGSGWESYAIGFEESWLGVVDWEDREVCELHWYWRGNLWLLRCRRMCGLEMSCCCEVWE